MTHNGTRWKISISSGLRERYSQKMKRRTRKKTRVISMEVKSMNNLILHLLRTYIDHSLQHWCCRTMVLAECLCLVMKKLPIWPREKPKFCLSIWMKSKSFTFLLSWHLLNKIRLNWVRSSMSWNQRFSKLILAPTIKTQTIAKTYRLLTWWKN